MKVNSKKINTKRYRCYLGVASGVIIILMLVFVLNRIFNSGIADSTVIAKVNNEHVQVKEFILKANQNRSKVYDYFKQTYGIDDNKSFWFDSYGGESPVEKLKEITLKELTRIKIEQSLAKQYGIIKDTSYKAFLQDWKAENKRRKAAAADNEVIYGPIQYSEMDYYNYVYSNMVIEIKRMLGEKEFTFTDSDYMQYYEFNKEQLYKKADFKEIKKIVVPYTDEWGVITESKKREARLYIEKLKDRIGRGEAFEDVFKENAVTQKDGGVQVFDEKSEYMDQKKDYLLFKKVTELHKGQVSEIFEFKNAFYMIQCFNEKHSGYLPIEEVKGSIKADLIDLRYKQIIEQKVNDARVNIIESIFRKICGIFTA